MRKKQAQLPPGQGPEAGEDTPRRDVQMNLTGERQFGLRAKYYTPWIRRRPSECAGSRGSIHVAAATTFSCSRKTNRESDREPDRWNSLKFYFHAI
jgi:hypothetical protein